jgi:division protein CdvB (Snf7/Vps24/ESCRT-III family)
MGNWDKDESHYSKIKVPGILRQEQPLKEKISRTIYKLKVQQNKLDNSVSRMQNHDKELFNKCVKSQMAKDSARATMYANECAEIRKMASITLRSQLALEQVALRLETIREFGDIAALMGPVSEVVRSVKTQISGIMPEMSFELDEIGDTLNSMMVEVGEATGQHYNTEASSSEAQKILSEAGTVAEQRVKEKFPDFSSMEIGTSKISQFETKESSRT